MQALIKIGKIQNTHGVKGDLIISHFLKNNQEIKSWKALLIEINKGSFIPFFIEQFKNTNPQEILCKLEEINNPEDAKSVVGCNVYASPLVQVSELIKSDWDDVIGFFIIEKNAGALGQIQSVSQGVGQQFFEINYGSKLISIPIQENWIVNVDAKTKTITLELPDGFLEIFG